MPGWYCTNCDEAVSVGKDMDVTDRALVRLKAEAEHLLQPEEVKKIRKKLALSQVEAGELLGGGRNAFQKYETAQITTSKALTVLLRILDQEPRMLEIVRTTEGNVVVSPHSAKKSRKQRAKKLAR